MILNYLKCEPFWGSWIIETSSFDKETAGLLRQSLSNGFVERRLDALSAHKKVFIGSLQEAT